MINTVANEDLTIELLPSVNDRQKVFKFAMLFNGYEYYGSLEAAAKKAQTQTRESLTEIRNELFFSARASRHCDDERYLEVYQELLPIFKKKIGQ